MNVQRLLFGLSIAAVMAASCAAAQASPSPSLSVASSALKTVEVTRGTLARTVKISGSVRSAAQYHLGFKVPGRLAQRFVVPGERVEAGQLLAQLETGDLQAAVVAAQARYDQVQAGASAEDVASAKLAVDSAERTLDSTQQTTSTELTAAKDALWQLVASYTAGKTSVVTMTNAIGVDSADVQSRLADARALSTRSVSDIQASLYQTAEVVAVRNTMSAVDGTLASTLDLLPTLRAGYADYALQRDNVLAALSVFESGASATATQSYQAALTAYNAAAARYAIAVDAGLAPLPTAAASTATALGTLNGPAFRIYPDLEPARSTLAKLQVALTATQQAGASLKAEMAQIATAVPALTSYVVGGLAGAQQAVTGAQQRASTSVSASQSALDGAKLSLQKVSAAPKAYDVAAAYAALLLAQSDLDGATLRAPASGTVLSIGAEVGENVASAFVVLNSATLQLHGTVGEADVAKLATGQTAAVRIEAVGGSTLSGTITAIDAGPTQGSVPLYGVDVTIANPVAAIRPGMSGAADVVVLSRDNVLLVPTATVRIQGTRTFVQIVKDGQPVDREVALGDAANGMTEIVSGLSPGETVAYPRAR